MSQKTTAERESTVEAAIEARLVGLDSGNYRANSEFVLREFAEFLRAERGVNELDEIDVLDCRRYAQHLRARVNDPNDQLSAASAHANGPYFTVVRSFLGWCVDDERIDVNPARPNRVKSELPSYRGVEERQFWTKEAREGLLNHVDVRAKDALEARDETSESELLTAFRDRAVAYVLAFTGVRGAEIFADPKDDRRNGITWAEVDFERGLATVLGKNREIQDVALTDRVLTVLKRYYDISKPPASEWPVFPTGHRPSLARSVRERLGERGYEDDEIADALCDGCSLSLLRELEVRPPALSKNGGRSLMKRLCEAADVDVDGEYLKPHGGRRSLGDELYAVDAELAQETLRHASVETTHEAYRNQRAVERRERIDEVLKNGRGE